MTRSVDLGSACGGPSPASLQLPSPPRVQLDLGHNGHHRLKLCSRHNSARARGPHGRECHHRLELHRGGSSAAGTSVRHNSQLGSFCASDTKDCRRHPPSVTKKRATEFTPSCLCRRATMLAFFRTGARDREPPCAIHGLVGEQEETHRKTKKNVLGG
jgi:hypothetical protein